MGRKANDGIYMVSGPDEVLTPFRSELAALREAVRLGGDCKFVKWGQPIHEADSIGDAPRPTDQQEMDA